MKMMLIWRDYSFRVNSRTFVQYCAGVEYKRVPEFQVRAILSAKAGEIVKGDAE